MTSTTEPTLDRLERLAQRILCNNDRPLYFRWRWGLPQDFAAADEVLGLTSASLDLTLRPYINAWEGRGRGIVFNGDNIVAEFGSGVLFTEGLHQVLLHELSHVVCGGFPDDGNDSHLEANDRKFSDAQMRCSVPPVTTECDWFDLHPAPWWRALGHLIARAHGEGLQFDPFAEHERHSLSSAEQYDDILADEISAMLDMPLIEALRSTDPPQEFLDLFNADITRIRASY